MTTWQWLTLWATLYKSFINFSDADSQGRRQLSVATQKGRAGVQPPLNLRTFFEWGIQKKYCRSSSCMLLLIKS